MTKEDIVNYAKELIKSADKLIKFSNEIPDNIKIEYDDNEDVYSISEYDNNGNQIHFKDSAGYETWREYDNNGKLIHSKDSDGYEACREYDSNGKLIHSKNSNGYEEWY